MRVFVILALSTAVARANPDDAIHAGPQPVPPLVLKQETDARGNVRGCPVGETCTRPSDAMREIDVELFPRGGNPWLDERSAPASRVEVTPPRRAKRPSELRPDAAWLDRVELPDLPVAWTQRLVDYLVFYKDDPRGRSIMKSWLQAQGRYRDMILYHLRQAKLPDDLLYVAMIESSYDPDDVSSAGALGLWQWMPAGAKIYGLRVDRWVDERRDPLRSTIAQMDYFRDLHQRFGDWHVALAAFNAGYGAVLRSIARYNTNDYYQLCELENGLPWETCLYTPKVLATAIVGHNKKLFGYDEVAQAAPEAWDEVAVPASLSVAVIARASGASEADIKRLNPQLRHGRTPPGEAGYIVRVPAGARPDFQRKLVELGTEWQGYDAYVVAHGERFEDVATTYGMTVGQLRKLNDVARDAEIEGGVVIVVPRISEEARAKNRAKAKAKLLGSGVDQKEGEALIVAVPDKDARVDGKKRVFYRVIGGDTVHAVAKALGVTAAELVKWNALDESGKLHAKMILQAWVAPDFDADAHHVALLDEESLAIVTRGSAEHLDLAEARAGRVRSEYVATKKERLADVAKRYGLGSHDLARINRMSYDAVLDKGQKIIVYEVKDPGRSTRADEQWKKTPRGQRGKVSKERAKATATATKARDDGGGGGGDEAETDGNGGGPVTSPTQIE